MSIECHEWPCANGHDGVHVHVYVYVYVRVCITICVYAYACVYVPVCVYVHDLGIQAQKHANMQQTHQHTTNCDVMLARAVPLET